MAPHGGVCQQYGIKCRAVRLGFARVGSLLLFPRDDVVIVVIILMLEGNCFVGVWAPWHHSLQGKQKKTATRTDPTRLDIALHLD